MNKVLLNLLEFYLDPENENEKALNEFCKETENECEMLRAKLKKLLRNAKAEKGFTQGRKGRKELKNNRKDRKDYGCNN